MSEETKGPGKKTVLGISENLEAVLTYAVGWVTGIVFILIEKENDFVRFHALQSLVTFLGLAVVSFGLMIIPFLGPLISFLLWPLGFILWILLMVKAYQGERFKLPYVGDFVEKNLSK